MRRAAGSRREGDEAQNSKTHSITQASLFPLPQVQSECAKMCMSWLENCDHDVLQLLGMVDVEVAEEGSDDDMCAELAEID